ncbi:DEAD/DEAH box helicase [Winogradskya humida]|uniref:AAA+ ATPase domain-containing protein n=1 Tax=Winogradskya humida TaxID=113566 RepID=A0ABQ3ZQJ6_9ACTN|nr:AAA domain-containing protein [Actinoplanes humidus]GIE20818.1 hypothetical protein Ahu01nite_039200 [Actinoplanes humidus]
MRSQTVLSVLAELAPAGGDRVHDVTRGGQPLVWLDDAERAPRNADSDRLAAVDALHREERVLRRAWGFIAGQTEIDGVRRKVRVPLLTQPVRIERGLTGYRVVPAGDAEITPLVEDRELAAAMESAPGLGSAGWLDAIGTRAWLWSVAEATGLPIDATTTTTARLPGDRLVMVCRAALFVARDVFGGGLVDGLRSWSGRDLTGTAFAAIYDPPDSVSSDEAPAGRGDASAGGAVGRGGAAWHGDGSARGGPVSGRRSGSGSRASAEEADVLSPLPLTRAQAEVVARARTAAVTVVSGPPGSGKSHTVIAAALEVVHRGGSVLVATQSPHAADVLAELLTRYPGPVPVLFGNAERRAALAAGLAAGAEAGVGERDLRADRQAVSDNHSSVRQRAREIEAALTLHSQAAELVTWQPLLPGLAADVPGAFDDAVDLDEVVALLETDHGPSRWGRWRAGRARKRGLRLLRPTPGALGTAGALGTTGALGRSGALGTERVSRAGGVSGTADASGARGTERARGSERARGTERARGAAGVRGMAGMRGAPGVPDDRVGDAIRAATAQRAEARLAATGGTDLDSQWAALHAAEDTLAEVVGEAMRRAARSRKRWDGDARRGTAALASALRAGRNRRRELLARLDAVALVRALPLWIGTVSDVDDLLPATPGMFDLVVLDEASHVDQIRAAPVLARARRALVVGDPRQLRFVSFVSDVDVAEVLTRHGADDRLDVRRVSAYDLAAGAAPTTWLDEHHRSSPALIGFSAKRFYDDRITVATRHPRTETQAPIDVVRVHAATVTKGVNAAEVDAVVGVVRSLAESGRTGIGVVSPFRAQAEALEKSLLKAFPAERIEQLGLRVGTVHAFQGSEAATVVASLGLVPSDAAGRRRFVTDPHLFNVMITRARRHLVMVTSLPDPDGLLGDFFAYAEKPPHPDPGPDPTGWPGALAAELRKLDLPVRPRYEVGTWHVDLCTGRPETAIGIFCEVHPDGPPAHIARHRALHRTGWHLIDALPSRYHNDPRRAALEIAAALTPAALTPAAQPAASSGP